MTRFADDKRQQLLAGLVEYSVSHEALAGATTEARRQSLVEQMVESMRRIEFVKRISIKNISPVRSDPERSLFDPLRAASLHFRNGNLDEAFWLVFLATHFGKHLKDQWRLTRDIYRGDGVSPWTFARVANNPDAFDTWLAAEYERLKGDGVSRRFGNHRKYETLRPDSARGTNRVLQSYIAWVGANRQHTGLLSEATEEAGADPKALFNYLYDSMKDVQSFGRTARFDFLTMVGKLGLANIEPGIPYLVSATGPLAGARLLFGGSKTFNLRAEDLDDKVAALGAFLNVGMQVMEDALCNWQKSPDSFIAFRG